MESSLMVKKQKVIDNMHNMNDIPVDRFSGLPDTVLHQILSSVPTKYVVQMSTFSRKLRYLWTSMPTLNIDDDLFSPFWIMNNKYSVESMRFVGFVYKVLLFHDASHIERFRLTLSSYDIYVNSWISIAVRKNVQELYLRIYKSFHPIKLPDCLFTCKSLVSLELNLQNSQLRLPKSICFTQLKTLHLDAISFPKNKSFRTLISSCPVLENLIIERCQWSDKAVVVLSSPTVRSLSINNMVVREYHIFKISIPNLMTFNYIDFSAKTFQFLYNPVSLVDVFIRMKSGSVDRIIKLLRGVSNARCVTLSDLTLEILSKASKMLETRLTFHNLNKLMLTDAKIQNLLVIACLLRITPVLESLLIDIKPYYEDHLHEKEGQESINGQESKLKCLEDLCLDHLKLVKITYYGGSNYELEFLKLLLRCACTMERLIITIRRRELDQITEINEKLQMYQRASESCIILLSLS